MSDFLNDMQCDELINGQSFDGQYVPTEQDLADMNQAWGTDMSSYVTDCDYCGEIAMCFNDEYGGTCCNACAANLAVMTAVVDASCEDDYIETESDVYQDSSYDDEPNGWSDHLEGYGCDD